MSFAGLITEAAAASSGARILTDGRFACSYSELPDLLEGINRHLEDQGIEAAEIPALECINTLPGALTLLALLYQGRRFLLLPGTGHRETALEFRPVARFCKYRIAVERVPPDTAAAWPAPGQFLHVSANAGYRGIPAEMGGAGTKLYLRTSGSMGAAKIVVHDHARLLGNALNCRERFGLSAADRVTLPVPIFHMYGLGAGFLPAIAAGAAVNLDEHSNILRYLESERRFHPDVAFLNPLLCEMLLRGRRSEGGYKRVITATQRIREETFRAFDERFGSLVSLYGSTEMGAVAAGRPEDPLDWRATALGPPMTGVELRLGAAEAIPAAGTAAELFCRHPHGFEGYLDDEGHWLHRAAADEWYRTGDVAATDSAGRLAVLGRADSSVNRNGYLVLLGDIENAVEKLAGVAQAVVVASGNEAQRGPRLTAFCALRNRAALSTAQIRTACFELLPKYAIPDDVIVINDLPLLPSGKVDRQALTAMAGRMNEMIPTPYPDQRETHEHGNCRSA